MIPGWVWLVGLAAAAAACGGDDSSGPEDAPDAGPVTVADNFFQPANVTVARTNGAAEVNWTWTGSNQHNVTFDAVPRTR
jgi:plastocyanin